MKTIEVRFYGRVTKFNPPPETSITYLKNMETGEEIESYETVSEKLVENGIDHDDCEFEVIVKQDENDKVELVLKKLEPKHLSKEEVDKIIKEVEDLKLGDFNI